MDRWVSRFAVAVAGWEDCSACFFVFFLSI